MTSRVLVLDQGGQSTRGSVVTTTGEVEQTVRRSVSTHRSDPCVEHDADEVLGSVRECLDELLASRVPIAGVGLATQRSSLLAWDRDTLSPLSPILSWQDRRAEAELAGLALDPSAIRIQTGLQPSAHYGASKYAWLLRNEPRVARAHERGQLRLGPLASYLAACLTADHRSIVDDANAQRTLLWSLTARDWDLSLLETFEIPRDVLPRCVRCLGDHGTIPTADGGVPLLVLTGDQTAALYATGDIDRSLAQLNLGTGAFLQRIQDGHAPSGLLTSVTAAGSVDAELVWEGAVNGAGAAIAAESRTLGLVAPERELEAWLRETKEIPLFLNAVSGLGSPYWHPGVRSRYLEEVPAPPPAKIVAVLESILFLIAVNLEVMERHGGPVRAVEASGGLARSDALLARFAALIERPVFRRDDPEATARGLAFLTSSVVHGAPPATWSAGNRVEVVATPCEGLEARYARWRTEIEREIREG